MGGLGVIRLKYVHAFRDRTGRMRYYFRRHGVQTTLPGLPGSNEFMAAYGALLSETPQMVTLRMKAAPGTFAALAVRYYGSPQYQSLSGTSRANYRRVIDGFLEQHGHRQVKQMTREHVDIIIGKMASKPGAGITLLKRVRTLLRYAMALGWTDRDPTAGVKAYRSKEIHTWNEEEIAAFEKRWPEGSRERLAFALLLYTGQRGSDVHRMLWTDYVGDTIRVAQQKTKTKLTIPIHENSRALAWRCAPQSRDDRRNCLQQAILRERLWQHDVRRNPRGRIAITLQSAWPSKGSCSTPRRSRMFGERDCRNYRAQNSRGGRTLHARGGPRAVGETGDPETVQAQKWQTGVRRSGKHHR